MNRDRGQAESLAKDPKSRARFRGTVTSSATCIWCHKRFTFARHYGRPRALCSNECIAALTSARAVAQRHYSSGAVQKLCPPIVDCWMCSGDFRGGPPLTTSELPFHKE